MKNELRALIREHGAADVLREVAALIREQAAEALEGAEDDDASVTYSEVLLEDADAIEENADDLEDAGIEYDRATQA